MKNYIKQTRIQAILFNVLIFPLIYFLPPEYLGLSITSLGYPSSLFLNTFIHAGILHIAMNMLVTYQFGGLIDEFYQKKEQYLLYFALGIPITAIMYLYIYTLQPEILLVGYSGIAMGLVKEDKDFAVITDILGAIYIILNGSVFGYASFYILFVSSESTICAMYTYAKGKYEYSKMPHICSV